MPQMISMEPSAPVPAPASPSARINPEDWVGEHGDYLLRHALSRVGDPETAKDLVQETFLAAWRSADRYAGRASERTWLLRILRNKIADHYRKRIPELGLNDIEALSEMEEKQFAAAGLGSKSWAPSAAPENWRDAGQSLERAEFWAVVHACAGKLPRKIAQVFLLREVDGWESPEICRELNIKQNHLGVLLHRARLALRRCLELNWFKDRA